MLTKKILVAITAIFPFLACTTTFPKELLIEFYTESVVDTTTDAGEALQENSPLESFIEAETEVNADPVSKIPCKELWKNWDAFKKKHRNCKVDTDCEVVGYIGDCNCSYNLDFIGGNGISRSAVKEAQKYIDRFLSDECASIRVCYADAPRSESFCYNNLCSAKAPKGSLCRP